MNAFQILCPCCRSPYRQIKWGRTPTGSQRYRCQVCRRVYTPAPRKRGYPEEMRRAAVQMHLNGIQLRRIARQLGVHHQSVANWVNRHLKEI